MPHRQLRYVSESLYRITCNKVNIVLLFECIADLLLKIYCLRIHFHIAKKLHLSQAIKYISNWTVRPRGYYPVRSVTFPSSEIKINGISLKLVNRTARVCACTRARLVNHRNTMPYQKEARPLAVVGSVYSAFIAFACFHEPEVNTALFV